MDKPIPKKRGRKPKNLTKDASLNVVVSKNNVVQNQEPKVYKKRGRKPKGGKIIEKIDIKKEENNYLEENIILHLKCNTEDIKKSNIYEYNPVVESVNPFNINETNNLKYNSLCKEAVDDYMNTTLNSTLNNYQNIKEENQTNDNTSKLFIEDNNSNQQLENKDSNDSIYIKKNNIVDVKNIQVKIKSLQQKFYANDNINKKSNCFWCTYPFNNNSIHIPINIKDNMFNVYGCFCCPECAAGYLMNENIDNSVKFERYALLNLMYSNIYNYKSNIKPAPPPYYLLDKYNGTLSINEYRKAITEFDFINVVSKPFTQVFPEIHQDNNVSFNENNSLNVQKPTSKKNNKTNILNENFGL